MLGAIIGDIVGSIYEFNPIKSKKFPLFQKQCFFTDDTVLTLAIAQALMDGSTKDDFISNLKEYTIKYPDRGYGGRYIKWALSDDKDSYNSYGNGSAMRVSPIAWWYDTLEQVELKAKESAIVTHSHPEGVKGAQATAASIFLARTGSTKDQIKEYIEKTYDYDLSRTLEAIRPDYSFDVTCQGSVPEAIISFLESTDFEGAIRNAISLGGDADTMAAIAGSIAEGFYNVPKEFEEKGLSYLDDDLCSVYHRFNKKLKSI
jgi:ADP-ribosylglycohydrolase